MLRAGRTHWLVLVAIAVAIGGVIVVFMPSNSAAKSANDFMRALATDDRDALTSLTYWPGADPAEIRKKWDHTMEAGKYYRFAYKVVNEKQATDTQVGVTAMVMRNVMTGSSYEEKFEIPMVLEGGKWKVDVRGINREMFPALPR